MSKMLLAVYGSLRQGLHNHDVIKDCKYVGDCRTDPDYGFYSLGRFPGMTKHGDISVLMEVYEINAKVLEKVDHLESYDPSSNHNNFYTREIIKTPYGMAYTYFYVQKCNNREEITEGDWTDYYEDRKVIKILENANII